MFQGDHKDPEGGASFSMVVSQCLIALSSLIRLTYGPHTAQIHSSNGESTRSSDDSGPLFNMYLKVAEREDNKMATHWQDDSDAILIFVGPFVPIHLRTSTKRI